MTQTVIRRATGSDLSLILHMLSAESLPREGVEEHLHTFLVADREGIVIGAMGLEVYGATALLRSAVVTPAEKGKGIGNQLFNALTQLARSLGVTRLLLLTNTAEEYFYRKGFVRIDQKSVTGPVTASVEFSGACPSHAACMELNLASM